MRNPRGIYVVPGAVIDVRFAAGALPALREALLVEWDRPGARALAE